MDVLVTRRVDMIHPVVGCSGKERSFLSAGPQDWVATIGLESQTHDAQCIVDFVFTFDQNTGAIMQYLHINSTYALLLVSDSLARLCVGKWVPTEVQLWGLQRGEHYATAQGPLPHGISYSNLSFPTESPFKEQL